MRAVSATNCEDAIADISPSRPLHGIPMARWADGMPRGRRESKRLPWYRGHHAGIYDAYLTLKKKYPKIAEEFRKAFRMDKDGAYHLV